MIKVTKQQSLFVQATVMLVVGMLSIPMFQVLTKWLGGFVWPCSPWEHWYGWVTYVFIWIYAFLAWAFCWVAQYVMWFTPIVVLVFVIATLKERYQLKVEGYKKAVLFQARQLAKTWQQGRGFGKYELDAFLNVSHLALEAGIHQKDMQLWFLWGLRQGSINANQILEDSDFELLYPSTRDLATLPELWVGDKPCPVH